MKKILAISGSSSSKSINRELLNYAGKHLQEITITDLDQNIPIYSQDIEDTTGFPKEIKELNAKMKDFNGFILGLPEHNGSMTALFKNILDWLSRVDRKVFNDKPVLLLSTSPGANGGKRGLAHTENVISSLGAKVVGTYSLPNFYNTFDKEITDEEEHKKLIQVLKDFEDKL